MIDNKGGIFEGDPKWMHNCAKMIMKKLGVEYDVFKMYEIVKIIKEYSQ